MGVASIDDALKYAQSKELRDALNHCRNAHEILEGDISILLDKLGLNGKEPSLMVRIMSFVHIRSKLLFNHSDEDIKDLMLFGCEMGITSLEKELISRKEAEEKSREIAGKLILIERELKAKLSA